MKTKKILRFYFSADSLERAFDNLIIHKACDYGADALIGAERLCRIICEKICLGRLWAYLDGVLSAFSEEERERLNTYSSRRGTGGCGEVKKTLIKFTRRARRLGDFRENILALEKYYCLIRDGQGLK